MTADEIKGEEAGRVGGKREKKTGIGEDEKGDEEVWEERKQRGESWRHEECGRSGQSVSQKV